MLGSRFPNAPPSPILKTLTAIQENPKKHQKFE